MAKTKPSATIPNNGSGIVIINSPLGMATYTNKGVTVTPPNYSNVTIAGNGNTGLTYSTATTAIWGATSNQAKVRITEEDIEIKGTSLAKVLETLEERLAILVPNPKLEAEFEQLAELRHQYVELEKELKEKSKMWATLKTTDQ